MHKLKFKSWADSSQGLLHALGHVKCIKIHAKYQNLRSNLKTKPAAKYKIFHIHLEFGLTTERKHNDGLYVQTHKTVFENAQSTLSYLAMFIS